MTFNPVDFTPSQQGAPLESLLIIGDHASNRVPDDLDLGLAPYVMDTHRAVDLGTAQVSALLARQFGCAVANAAASRLVVDLNRHRDDPDVIPHASDAVEIPANQIGEAAHEARLVTFYDSYHARVGEIIETIRPKLLIFLHSFAPMLDSKRHQARPWHFGIMYDHDPRAGQIALDYLYARDIPVGDQLPYSGKIYNSTINRHGDDRGIANLGLEIRQDLLLDDPRCAAMAQTVGDMAKMILSALKGQI
ncbi:N-formylglutamate amidohydrolase [Alterisphingorhabdus coralli]|uniref:N-formylglutamate amidohydrolase n=1 Tax=Alterisphingorhabdus coralli TaxID=3071408 RepID=A0AA97I016_9SPHN|nr:N-formylglutamate amidohydrolase [Parasphingorhabdus sp. SCSIO 66989]WOE73968.1 N-formylglutamate amidohydrolase [Parasphingorhabdus sp. SCSIO 66989]